jgi:hypothetical protein
VSNLSPELLLKDPTRIHPSITLTLAKTIDSYGIDSRQMLSSFGIDIERDLTNDKRVVGGLNDCIWRAAER